MDEFASFNESFELALVAVLLLMALWGSAIVAIDYWVWAGRSDSPRRGRRGDGTAVHDDEA
jgi:hypothetical protein